VGPGDLRREFDYAAAVYGSVRVTALVGAAFEAHLGARTMTLTLLTTTLVFWLAHVWSEVMGVRLAGTVPTGATFGASQCRSGLSSRRGSCPMPCSRSHGPVSTRATPAELAMIAAVLQLAAWGFAAGWRTQHRLAPAIVTGAVDCAFGVAIVGLEVAIH
jgi:hypothetical protein